MDQRPALKGQQRFGFVGGRIFRQTGLFVLHNRAMHRLFKFGFQLQRGDRQAVDKQHQIDAPLFGFQAGFRKGAVGGIGAIHQLRYDAAEILPIARQGFRVQIVLGFKLAQGKRALRIFRPWRNTPSVPQLRDWISVALLSAFLSCVTSASRKWRPVSLG